MRLHAEATTAFVAAIEAQESADIAQGAEAENMANVQELLAKAEQEVESAKTSPVAPPPLQDAMPVVWGEVARPDRGSSYSKYLHYAQ